MIGYQYSNPKMAHQDNHTILYPSNNTDELQLTSRQTNSNFSLHKCIETGLNGFLFPEQSRGSCPWSLLHAVVSRHLYSCGSATPAACGIFYEQFFTRNLKLLENLWRKFVIGSQITKKFCTSWHICLCLVQNFLGIIWLECWWEQN